jgi:anti-sigma factor RsiW
MNVCQRTRKQIDESHRVEVLPIEASAHLETCRQCSQFSAERAALRRLLASGERISVPADFEVQLSRRLADLKTRRRGPIWLNPALYLRVGFATAALIVAALLVPGYLKHSDQEQAPSDTTAKVIQPVRPEIDSGGTRAAQVTLSSTPTLKPRPVKSVRFQRRSVLPRDTYLGTTEGGVILLRGNGVDIEMPVRTVSLGAQPLLYGPESGQPVRLVKASF